MADNQKARPDSILEGGGGGGDHDRKGAPLRLAEEYEKAIAAGDVMTYKEMKVPMTPQIKSSLEKQRSSFREFVTTQLLVKHGKEAVIKDLESSIYPGNDFMEQVLAIDTLIWLTTEPTLVRSPDVQHVSNKTQ